MSDPGLRHYVGWALRAVFLTGVLAGGWLYLAPLIHEREAHAATPVQLVVAGERVELTRSPRQTAEQLAHRYLAGSVLLRTNQVEYPSSRRALGARVDTDHLTSLLAAAADSRSPLRRLHARARGDRPLHLPMPTELDLARASALLTRLKDAVDVPALEPRLDPRQRYVLPGHEGQELDLYTTLDRLDAALSGGAPVVQAALRSVAPKQSPHALEAIELHAVLGEFQTHYSRASVSEDRNHDLKVAAGKLDGLVLQPGEVFDFNARVGDRTESNGFRLAPVIADGELIDGLGGGTCQIASTLHAAAWFAGLPILTRYPHSRPSYYIRLGLDATVVYGAQNFRFANDQPYPIVLGVTVDDGRVRATLYGRARTREVTFTRRIDTIMPFEERIIYDDALPDGVRVLQQRGIPGFKITRERLIRDNTLQRDTQERTNDTYRPTAQLWRVGTGGAAPLDYHRPRNDPHPEYVADAVLQMTQTDRGTEDRYREPGQTGSYGWTERGGLVIRNP